MSQPFTLSPAVKSLMLRFEGLSLTAYNDYKQYSIGYGSGVMPDGSKVKAGDKLKSKAEAIYLFDNVTAPIYIKGVQRVVQRTDLPNDALGILVSFAYNFGVGALETSTLLKRIEASRWGDIAREYSKWKNAGGQVLPALCRRRMEEYIFFRNEIIKAGMATCILPF